jgi:L-ribulokinase
MPSYVVGVDFGTESGRAVVIDTADGRELGSSVYRYANGVIDTQLPAPDDDVRLAPDWALQDPEDYLRTYQQAVPAALAAAGVDPEQVVGVGIDFTACTMLPTKADGTPLCMLPELRRQPHAWVKLWKHHAAQPEADRINQVARDRGEAWLPRYGGKISSEWFYSKALQILDEAPAVYDAADRLIEAADWVIWRLTGVETRNSCTAGYKAIWSKQDGFPSSDYFAALDPRLADIVDQKMSRTIVSIGDKAGALTDEAAAWTGLRPGTAVAVANVDAHVSVPAATVTEPGRMVMVMGTSICHMVMGEKTAAVEGMCGVVEDGILPGLFGYEAGQSAVGDIFAWFVDNLVPPKYHRQAERESVDVHTVLEREAAGLVPGQSGLVALDWWNGNRSILVDVDLSGLLLGATLATTAPEIYRALIEATAYGTRMIVESFETSGVPVNDIVACGGLPERNRLLMQIYADVTKRRISVAASPQTPALGSAMWAAVAAGADAGGYDRIEDAAASMARLRDERYEPDAARAAVYDELYAEYRSLHDYFGRGANDAMKRLRAIRARALEAAG